MHIGDHNIHAKKKKHQSQLPFLYYPHFKQHAIELSKFIQINTLWNAIKESKMLVLAIAIIWIGAIFFVIRIWVRAAFGFLTWVGLARSLSRVLGFWSFWLSAFGTSQHSVDVGGGVVQVIHQQHLQLQVLRDPALEAAAVGRGVALHEHRGLRAAAEGEDDEDGYGGHDHLRRRWMRVARCSWSFTHCHDWILVLFLLCGAVCLWVEL